MGLGEFLIGGAATGLDLLVNRPGSSPSAVPKKSILSSRVTLILSSDVGDEIDAAEFDQMSKTKILSEKKKFRPFGSMNTTNLVKDGGWELTLSGEKTDGNLDRLIYAYEKYLSGTGISSIPSVEASLGGEGVIGNTLLLNIKEFVNDNDGVTITYIYKDVTITSYQEDTPNDDSPITYTMNLFCPYRESVESSTVDSDKLETVLTNIISDILSRNKS